LLRKIKPRFPSLGLEIGAAFSHFDACGRTPVTEINQPHVFPHNSGHDASDRAVMAARLKP
jgi:hypothetical protein